MDRPEWSGAAGDVLDQQPAPELDDQVEHQAAGDVLDHQPAAPELDDQAAAVRQDVSWLA